jgi:glyoxylase-like metal-dependent hydrolase (beta-lactamase superfamily II)
MISLKSFVFNPFQVNSFVVFDDSLECVIIDASCYGENEFQTLFEFIAQNSLNPVAVLNTHGHVDHLTGSKRVCDKYSIGMVMHQNDQFLLENAVELGRVFGFNIETPPKPASYLQDGDTFQFGSSIIKSFHTPGHSPGSLVFYAEEAKFLISGDVLFAGSIGRTDLQGGDYHQLIESIKSRIMVLPSNTRVFPGHGNETTIGAEREHNPFLNRSF